MTVMRRVLAFLILLIVPLQMSYAAAAAYCEHESRPAQGGHLGHHAHQHQESPAGKSKIPGKLHPDCAQCHFVYLSVVAADCGPCLVSDPRDGMRATEPHLVFSLSLDTPDRPPALASL